MSDHDYDTNHAIEPDLPEVYQEDGPATAVDVRVRGPVSVNELPARVGNSRNIVATDSADPANLEQIATEDPRRKWLFVSVTGNPCYVGFDKQMVANGQVGILPVGIMLPIPVTEPVWVRCATPAGTSVVSYWAGHWAN